jgi:flagellar P-ring protein precursor FlgI
MRKHLITLCMVAGALAAAATPQQAPIRDLATVAGVRDNQLVGYGLIVGLNGTGDRRQTMFSAQSLTNLLERMGVSVPPSAIRVSNTAAVLVTATLPPFAEPGMRIDVTVSAIGDATSLQGGTLILSSLRGPDGEVYALAQGPVVLGGYMATAAGSSKTLNHPTAGRIPNGAIVERRSPAAVAPGQIQLQLRKADFTTASKIAEALNRQFSPGSPIARAVNGGAVSVTVPPEFRTRETDFIARIENIQVESRTSNRVVINERTGTIVMGSDVVLSPATILHGALVVEIQTNFNVSQPQPFSQGQTQVVPEVSIKATEERPKPVTLSNGATVEQLAKALTSIGATARDIIAILQSLRAAGALDADLEVI